MIKRTGYLTRPTNSVRIHSITPLQNEGSNAHQHLPNDHHHVTILFLLLDSSPCRIDFVPPEVDVPPVGDDVSA